MAAHLEEGSGWSTDKPRSRPADVLVTNWNRSCSAAIDVSVTSPLNPSHIMEAGMSSGVAAKAVEERKHAQNDPKCIELRWQCIPFVAETYGAWGAEARQALSQVATRLAICCWRPKSQVLRSP